MLPEGSQGQLWPVMQTGQSSSLAIMPWTVQRLKDANTLSGLYKHSSRRFS